MADQLWTNVQSAPFLHPPGPVKKVHGVPRGFPASAAPEDLGLALPLPLPLPSLGALGLSSTPRTLAPTAEAGSLAGGLSCSFGLDLCTMLSSSPNICACSWVTFNSSGIVSICVAARVRLMRKATSGFDCITTFMIFSSAFTFRAGSGRVPPSSVMRSHHLAHRRRMSTVSLTLVPGLGSWMCFNPISRSFRPPGA